MLLNVQIINQDRTIKNAVVNINHIMVVEPADNQPPDAKVVTYSMELTNGRRIPVAQQTYDDYVAVNRTVTQEVADMFTGKMPSLWGLLPTRQQPLNQPASPDTK